MSPLRRLSLRGFALVLVVMLGGCANIIRLDAPPPAATIDLPVLGIPNARFWPDGPPEPLQQEVAQLLQRQRAGTTGPLPPAHFLALSGGGDNGAYGAGLLTGWTATGTRPPRASEVLLTTSTRPAGAPTQGGVSTPELNSSVALQRTGPRGVWEAVPVWEAVLLGVEVVVVKVVHNSYLWSLYIIL